jgi:hypothetical protein
MKYIQTCPLKPPTAANQAKVTLACLVEDIGRMELVEAVAIEFPLFPDDSLPLEAT